MKKMKKAIAAMLAATMVMGMSMTAWAEGIVSDDTPPTTTEIVIGGTVKGDAASENNVVQIPKGYTVDNEYTDAKSPQEIFQFEVKSGVVTSGEATSAPSISIKTNPEFAVGSAGTDATSNLVVALPKYDRVGIYTYTIEEKESANAGVVTLTTPITLVVTVTQEGNDKKVSVAVHCENPVGEKMSEFVNKYQAGSLNVKKTVVGNIADRDKKFEMTVKFEAPSEKNISSQVTYYDKDGVKQEIVWADTDEDGKLEGEARIAVAHNDVDGVTISNIPYGVTYTVTEDTYTGYTPTSTDNNGTVDAASKLTTITNTMENATVDTGIMLDSVPYILLLALAGLGAFAVVCKKREEEF